MARQLTTFEDPPVTRWLLGDTRSASVWLVIRLYVGWAWLDSGIQKVIDGRWMDGGAALAAYWETTTQLAQGVARAPVSYDWYRIIIVALLESDAYIWAAKVIALGEVAVGLAMIAGALTGFAALGGAFMSVNVMLSGSSSANPILLVLAMLILLGWKVAGYHGLDRALLPLIGTPWRRTSAPDEDG